MLPPVLRPSWLNVLRISGNWAETICERLPRRDFENPPQPSTGARRNMQIECMVPLDADCSKNQRSSRPQQGVTFVPGETVCHLAQNAESRVFIALRRPTPPKVSGMPAIIFALRLSRLMLRSLHKHAHKRTSWPSAKPPTNSGLTTRSRCSCDAVAPSLVTPKKIPQMRSNEVSVAEWRSQHTDAQLLWW